MKNYRKSLLLSAVVLCVLTACSEEKKQTSVVEEKPQVRLETVNVQSGRPDAGIYRYRRSQCGK